MQVNEPDLDLAANDLGPLAWVLDELRAIVTADLRSILPSIAVPVLIIVGSEDRVLPEVESRNLAASIPAARLEVLKDVGHLSNIEAPEQFNSIVCAFLVRVGLNQRSA